jgi:hypothetical protein
VDSLSDSMTQLSCSILHRSSGLIEDPFARKVIIACNPPDAFFDPAHNTVSATAEASLCTPGPCSVSSVFYGIISRLMLHRRFIEDEKGNSSSYTNAGKYPMNRFHNAPQSGWMQSLASESIVATHHRLKHSI